MVKMKSSVWRCFVVLRHDYEKNVSIIVFERVVWGVGAKDAMLHRV